VAVSEDEGSAWTNDTNHQITTTRPLAIASRNGDLAHAALTGSVDEVAIWDGVVLDQENAEWLHENSVSHIPEPGSFLLLLGGLLAVLARRQDR
jgi:hypothetical protein